MTQEPAASLSEQTRLAARRFDEAVEFHRRGRLEQAEKLYRLILEQQPDHFGSLHLLGVIHAQRGDHAQALRHIDAAIAINRNDADAHNNRGIALKELHRLLEALASCDQALAVNPRHVNAWVNRGNVLLELKRLPEALHSFDRAIALDPSHANAFHNRGNALVDLENLDDALKSYDRAVQLDPHVAEYFNGRGTVLKDLGRLPEALANYDRCLALNPQHSDARNNRGVVLMESGHLDDALASYDRAIALNPHYDEAYNNRGMAKLLLGRFAEGWSDYEHRWAAKTFLGERSHVDAPQWRGEDLDGRRILIFGEQGLGDTIQFVRYLPLLAERGAKVTLLVRESLLRLLQPLTSSADLVSHVERSAPFDFQCAIMSLPSAFETAEDTIPCRVPYLAAEPYLAGCWKLRIGPDGFKIGVVWHAKSSRTAEVRRHGFQRSFPLAELAPLARMPGVRLISLQKHDGLDQLLTLPAGMKVETFSEDFDSGPDAFVDSAAIMESLDLLLTADTSMAHLAGALARPAWVLLKYVPDWRWQLHRDDSPWYPTLRLFRQDADGDWASAVAKAVNALHRIIHGTALS